MDDLSTEYQGRVRVTRFEIMSRFGAPTSPLIQQRYDVNVLPMVILFNRGVEVNRWVAVYLPDFYRHELDKLVPPPRPAVSFGRLGGTSGWR